MDDENEQGPVREVELGLAKMEHLKGQMENLRLQAQSLQSVIIDHQRSMDVLKDLMERKEGSVLVPLGASVLLRARIEVTDSCLLNQGAGVIIGTSNDEAFKKLGTSVENLRQTLASMERAMQELIGRYDELAARTQELYNGSSGQGKGPDATF